MNQKDLAKKLWKRNQRIMQILNWYEEEKSLILDEIGIFPDSSMNDFESKMKENNYLVLSNMPNESLGLIAFKNILKYCQNKAEIKIALEEKNLFNHFQEAFPGIF